LGVFASLVAILGLAGAADAQDPDKADPKTKPAPKGIVLTSDAWRNAPVAPATAAEIDELLAKELEAAKLTPAPLTTDEQFLRRVSLDLTGKLPSAADVEKFAADKDPKKRARVIDALLETDDYTRHWARYWREVFMAKQSDGRGRLYVRNFDDWMAGQLKTNKSWGETARALITAEGELRFDKPAENGQAFFLLTYRGPEGANDRAAETSRVFLGIQIRCAQCHDHPFDSWKQNQFHEMAAYYGRLSDRPVRGDNNRIVGVQTAPSRGEHRLPGTGGRPGAVVQPKFLDGKAPAQGLNDKDRRSALADAITDKNNYWFSGSYVNRMWGELLGQAFNNQVDDMGPEREVIFGSVLTRLASSFRATNYDPKEMFRLIANTQAYQRQVRPGESSDQHLHFTGAYPKRLDADALWHSLNAVLGKLEERGMGGRPGPGGRGPVTLEAAFRQLFGFDPSLKADDIEGGIAQALMLMNNPTINKKIDARGETPLAKILKDNPTDDDAALKALYQHTLARKPTDPELQKLNKYIKKVDNRAEAFEDILWSLINSTEFQTKR